MRVLRPLRSVIVVAAALAAACDDAVFARVFRGQCQRPEVSERYVRDTIGSAAAGLRFYWYDLPSEYNAELQQYWNARSRRHGYGCDIGCSECTEDAWGKRGMDMAVRQNGASAALLAKLAVVGRVAADPRDADFFVVPSYNHLFFSTGWAFLVGANATKQQELFDRHLPHYSKATAARHIFFAGDEPSMHDTLRRQALVVHSGPRVPAPYAPPAHACLPGRPLHIVVPDPLIENHTLPFRYEHNGSDRDVFLFYFGALLTHIPIRQRVVDDVLRFQHEEERRVAELGRGVEQQAAWRRANGTRRVGVAATLAPSPPLRRVVVKTILEKKMRGGGLFNRHLALHYNKKNLTPKDLRGYYNRSRYCLVVAGDIPHQTRFFRAVLHGCLPVVLSFRGAGGEESWWRESAADSNHSTTPLNYPSGSYRDSLPFADKIPYKDFVVTVPHTSFAKKGLMPHLLSISDAEYHRRVAVLLKHRAAFSYNLDATADEDAFSLFLKQLHATHVRLAAGDPGVVPCEPSAAPGRYAQVVGGDVFATSWLPPLLMAAPLATWVLVRCSRQAGGGRRRRG